MSATGYSLGTTFAPNWMDWPMFYHGNPEPAAPGQVFFIHIIIFDAERGLVFLPIGSPSGARSQTTFPYSWMKYG